MAHQDQSDIGIEHKPSPFIYIIDRNRMCAHSRKRTRLPQLTTPAQEQEEEEEERSRVVTSHDHDSRIARLEQRGEEMTKTEREEEKSRAH